MNCLKMDKLIVLARKIRQKGLPALFGPVKLRFKYPKGDFENEKIILTVAVAGLLSACSLMGPSHSVKGEVVDASHEHRYDRNSGF